MKKELLDFDVTSIQDKQYLTDVINFWLHSFLLRIAKNHLDTDDIYNFASALVKFRQRIGHNKSKVEITSTLQLLLFLDVLDVFIEGTISHKTGQVNSKYIHNLDEIASILKFEELLLKFSNNYSKQYPLNKREAHLLTSICNISNKVEQSDMDYFDSKCTGTIQVHFK